MAIKRIHSATMEAPTSDLSKWPFLSRAQSRLRLKMTHAFDTPNAKLLDRRTCSQISPTGCPSLLSFEALKFTATLLGALHEHPTTCGSRGSPRQEKEGLIPRRNCGKAPGVGIPTDEVQGGQGMPEACPMAEGGQGSVVAPSSTELAATRLNSPGATLQRMKWFLCRVVGVRSVFQIFMLHCNHESKRRMAHGHHNSMTIPWQFNRTIPRGGEGLTPHLPR